MWFRSKPKSNTIMHTSKALKLLAAFLVLSFVLAACDDDDNTTATSSTDPQPVLVALTNATGLRISLLTDDGEDETSDFDSYLFVFQTNDTVTATNSTETVNGTYSLFTDDGRLELRIAFPNTPGFSELNDDWYFISIDQTTIRFDDSGDVLEFEQQ